MMRRRHTAALGAALLVTAATAAPLMLHARAAGPSNPSFPDFSNNAVTQETKPAPWALDVVTGGLQAGDPIKIGFTFDGGLPDHLHAVAFTNPGSSFGNTSLTVSSLPALPQLDPTGTLSNRPQQCVTGQTSYQVQAVADPYSQTVTLPSPAGFAAGTVMVFCFRGGALGFPVSPATKGYAVSYTENGNSIAAPYAVSAQASPPASPLVRVLGSDGADLTGAGIGAGASLLVYGSAYRVTLVGNPAGRYSLVATAYMDPAATVDVTGDPGPTPACPGGSNLFCPYSSGVATGTVTIKGGNAATAYVVLIATETQQVASSTEAPVEISVSAGPSGALPPGVATPTPSASLQPGETPVAKPFDTHCPLAEGSYAPTLADGSLELYDADNQVFMPDFRLACPAAAQQLTFLGVTDSAALQSRFTDSPPDYTFAGLDRPLSPTEYGQYAPSGGSTAGVQQFPVDLEPLAVTYNLDAPNCDDVGPVKLSSVALTAIFTGAVTQWSQLATVDQADDGNLSHCTLPILVAHDVGVASTVLKDYMSKRTPLWNAYKQPQLAASWPGGAPVACTANGSAAMALCVLAKPGTIGYGFYRAINAAGLPLAQVDNAAHAFFDASASSPLKGCTTVADPAQNPAAPQQTQQDFSTTTLTDAPVGYPICSFDFVTAPTNVCAKPNISRLNLNVLWAYLSAIYSPVTQGHLPARGFAQLPADLATTLDGEVTNLTCG